MFVIKTGEFYWHKNQHIILYQSPEEAVAHREAFMNYAINRYIQENEIRDPFDIMRFQAAIMESQIIPIDFEIEKNPHVKTIWRYELEN